MFKCNKIINNTCKLVSIKMKSYCMKCRKDKENVDPKTSSSSNGRAMILPKCAICGSKKSPFIKNQEKKGLLSNLGLRTPQSKVPISCNILFWMFMLNCTCLKDTNCKQHIK